MNWDLLTAPAQLLLIPLITLKDAISPPSSMTLNKRLGVAVLWNRVTIAGMALKKGASPHCDLHGGIGAVLLPTAPDYTGTPAIFSAALSGRAKMTDLLVAAGADINVKTGSGTTALLCAAESGKPRKVRFLLERGADPSIADVRGKTAFDYAQEKQLADVTALLTNPPPPAVQAASAMGSAASAFNDEAVSTAQSIAVKGPLVLKKAGVDASPDVKN